MNLPNPPPKISQNSVSEGDWITSIHSLILINFQSQMFKNFLIVLNCLWCCLQLIEITKFWLFPPFKFCFNAISIWNKKKKAIFDLSHNICWQQSLNQWFPTTALGTTSAPRAVSKCSPKNLKYTTCYDKNGVLL